MAFVPPPRREKPYSDLALCTHERFAVKNEHRSNKGPAVFDCGAFVMVQT
jgi:hypothetical protein